MTAMFPAHIKTLMECNVVLTGCRDYDKLTNLAANYSSIQCGMKKTFNEMFSIIERSIGRYRMSRTRVFKWR